MTDRQDNGNHDRDRIADSGAAASVSSLVEAGLPLEAGLRALSEEAPSRQLRRTLLRMSNELASGESPDEVLSRADSGLPRYVRGLVTAGIRSGQLGWFLEEFLLTVRNRRTSRQRFWMALMYPLLLMPLVLLGTSTLMWLLVPQFKEIYSDFGVELPAATMLLIGIGDILSPPVLIGFMFLVLAIVLLLQVMPVLFGGATWTRCVQRLPLIGTPSRMRGMSEFCSFLGLLVSGNIPLNEALEVTAGALQDANLKLGARKLAARVAGGETMSAAADQLPYFSADLRRLFHWEGRGESFGEILRQAGRVFAARSQVQLSVMVMFLLPFMLLFVGCVMAFTVVALFMPLIKLLNELS